ncbi:MAG: SCO family protein [Haloarculaceae archaeon]
MRRRTYLQVTAALGTAGLAGCVVSGDGNPDVVLPEPDREVDSGDLPYPAWGERVPAVTLPAPLADREVTLRALDRPQFLTFFYSHCNTVCPILVSALRNVQARALNEGYADEVVFHPTTFDPERDDADRLRTYGEEMNVDLAAGNWEFLRPASRGRAEEVVQEQFGVAFERTHPDDMEKYMFAHTALVVLVNGDGYVERAYRTKQPDSERLAEDLRTVRNA